MSSYNQYSTVPHKAERKGQLDSLRAFAILPVLYTHFWNDETWLGSAGVFLFFILSGYLITGILLRARGKPSGLRNFYVRRALRIAPIYYVMLMLAWLVNLQGARESIPWHALYLSNVWFTIHNSWEPWVTSHLWTLSVEEQFYLVWPFLILFIPLKAVRPAVLCVIAAGVSFQLFAGRFGINDLGSGTLIPASLDKLGVGALLALAETELGFPRLLSRYGWGAVVGILGVEVSPTVRALHWAYLLRTELLIVVFAALIAAASSGLSGTLGAILDCKVVQYVGRISYGIYLFHLFIYGAVDTALVRVCLPPLKPGPVAFILLTVISIVAAAVSWRFFEQPLNRLKERFGESQAVLGKTMRLNSPDSILH